MSLIRTSLLVVVVGLTLHANTVLPQVASPPIITAQPVSETVFAGSEAFLAVDASSTTPLGFQWQFNGTNLTGASNSDSSSFYVLTNAQRSDGGMYSIIVTNQFGAVTSAIATLTVFLPMVQQDWVSRYNGSGNTNDSPAALAVDGAGDVFVTGYSDGTNGTSDYATVKYSADGHQIWAARYHGPNNNSNDLAVALAIDGVGHVYVTGISHGADGFSDVATIKYDTNGTELWVARFNFTGNRDNPPVGLSLDSAGNIYVGGTLRGINYATEYAVVKYDPNGQQLVVARYNDPATYYAVATRMIATASGDVYVTGNAGTLKFDANGNRIWAAANNDIGAAAIATDSSGNFYMTGNYRRNIPTLAYGYATAKYDPNGQQLWVAHYDGPNTGYRDSATALAVDAAGNVYVTGYTFGSGTRDYTTVKYDENGNQLWVARYNGPWDSDPPFSFYANDYASAIAVDAVGNVYVSGYSGDGHFYTTTVKYDANGNQLWEAPTSTTVNGIWHYRSGGSPGSGVGAPAMVLGCDGNVYVTGNSYNEDDPELIDSVDYSTIKYSQSPPVAGFPQILVPPQSQIVLPGSDVVLSVEATGTPPLTYQWRRMGVGPLVSGATNATLFLTNVQGRSLDYSVIVTSADGMTVSPEARITFVNRLSAAQLLPSVGIQFQLSGESGSVYQIQSSSNLVDWISLSNVFNVAGQSQFLDSTATNASQRFYRAIKQP